MGSILSTISKQFNLVSEVFLSATLVVWDTSLNFINPFIQPWRSLFWFCFNIYVCLWSEIGSLTVKILVLPFRIYDAIKKEDMMEIEMRRIQELYMESKTRVREVECEMEEMFGECRRYKELLSNTEAEKRAILKKFQVLQLQVIELEKENIIIKAREECILKGIQDKTMKLMQKNFGSNRFEVASHNNELALECRNKDGFRDARPPHLPLKNMVGMTPSLLEDKHKIGKRCSQLDSKPKRISSADSNNRSSVNDKATYEGWEAAIFSSIFSVFLTLLVGTIAWQAQDPCVPLVVAVFMVVCMSLKTVSQFLLSIYNGPGFDAVALLSFNWFILGTLAYPVLPRIAQLVAPIGSRFGHWFLRLMGVTYVAEQLKSAFL